MADESSRKIPTKGEPADQAFRDWYNEIIGGVLKRARQIIFDDKGSHVPMILAFNDDTDQFGIVAVGMGSVEEKDLTFILQKAIAQVGTAVLISEVWTLALAPDDKRENYPDSLEHVPGRTEALLVNAMRGSMQLVGMYPIDRERSVFGTPKLIDPVDPTAGMVGRAVINEPDKH